jgi:hypothetical protein
VPPEHHRPDLAAADAALAIEGDGQRLARVRQRGDVREKRPRVEVDGVAAERLHQRHPRRVERLAEIRG